MTKLVTLIIFIISGFYLIMAMLGNNLLATHYLYIVWGTTLTILIISFAAEMIDEEVKQWKK